MLAKRLLLNKSFVALLVLIPLLIPLANLAMKQESGVVRIALCNMSSGSRRAAKITEALKNEESVVSYVQYKTESAARKAVQNGRADGAWIFHEDFDERFEKYSRKESIRPVVTVVSREESIRLNLAREKLFGKLYEIYVYEKYESFVREEVIPGEDISPEELEGYYRSNSVPSGLIEVRTSGSNGVVDAGADYLTAPLKGLMSLIVMLCGFAAAGIFIKEKTSGTYTWLPSEKRVIPAFGSCLPATLISGSAVVVSLFAGGIAGNVWYEAAMMASYAVGAASLCTFVCIAVDRFEAFGALIPFAMLAMMLMCPVFFNIRALPVIRFLMPPYYYLMSVQNPEYMIYSALFSASALLLSVLLARVRK